MDISQRHRIIATTIVLAELSLEQKELTDKWTKRRKEELSFGEMFKDERTYFPVSRGHSFWSSTPPPKEISEVLDKAGYYMPNYRNNVVYKKEDIEQKSKNAPRLLTVLKKELKDDPQKYKELEKMFVERKEGASQNADEVKMMICVSHNPYDVAGMSTDRNWTSCMELPGENRKDGGEYYCTALRQVKYGGMVAYLIAENDKEIKRPYARIAIKRLENVSGAFIFKQESRIYGDEEIAEDCDFTGELEKILEKSNRATGKENAIYTRDDHSYSDARIDYDGNNFDVDELTTMSPHELSLFIKDYRFNDSNQCFELLNNLADKLPNRKFSMELVSTIFFAMNDNCHTSSKKEIKDFYESHKNKISQDYIPEEFDEILGLE